MAKIVLLILILGAYEWTRNYVDNEKFEQAKNQSLSKAKTILQVPFQEKLKNNSWHFALNY